MSGIIFSWAPDELSDTPSQNSQRSFYGAVSVLLLPKLAGLGNGWGMVLSPPFLPCLPAAVNFWPHLTTSVRVRREVTLGRITIQTAGFKPSFHSQAVILTYLLRFSIPE